MTKRVVSVAVAGALLSIGMLTDPAGADHGGSHGRGDGPVTETDEGLMGEVRQQVDEVNQYVNRPPVPCTWRDENNVEHPGHLRIYLLREVTDAPGEIWAEGLQFTEECYPDEAQYRVDRTGEGLAEAPYILRTWIAPDITPENLARLALYEQFFLALPAPTPHFSPAGPTMVSIETRMWVTGIPDDHLESDPISVPGLTVQAFADITRIDWNMGNGDTKSCPNLATDEASAIATGCVYTYQRSSSGQPSNAYQGSVELSWLGTYTVNGTLASETFDIDRVAEWSLGVEEAQALNTGG